MYVEPTASQAQAIKRGYNINKVPSKEGKILQLLVYNKKKVESKVAAGTLNLDKYKIVDRTAQTKTASPDVWSIPIIHSNAKERTGYPTQKPLALLKRILQASSNIGDVIFDPFCGCATTCVAAQMTQRRWIGIDIEKQSVKLLLQRLSDDAGLFKDFIHLETPPKRTDITPPSKNLDTKTQLHFKQKGICNGCKNEYHKKDLEIDHIVPKNKGGGDYLENYQLLCGNCNRMKSDNPMNYLLAKIARQEEERLRNITF